MDDKKMLFVVHVDTSDYESLFGSYHLFLFFSLSSFFVCPHGFGMKYTSGKPKIYFYLVDQKHSYLCFLVILFWPFWCSHNCCIPSLFSLIILTILLELCCAPSLLVYLLMHVLFVLLLNLVCYISSTYPISLIHICDTYKFGDNVLICILPCFHDYLTWYFLPTCFSWWYYYDI